MNISSAIVIPAPGRVETVVAALKLIEGVEVAVVSPEGKVIVTIESDDDRGTIQTYESLSLHDGVLSVSMVYHQNEHHPDLPIDLQA